MKKKIATLVALAVIMCTTTFATNIDGNVNKNVLTAFNQKFARATEVSWSRGGNYVKASFNLKGQHLFAYFNEMGDLMGIARNIVTTQLPFVLQTQLAKEVASGWVTELFEFATEEDTIYYVTIENADQSVTLKSEGTGYWTVFKKSRKS